VNAAKQAIVQDTLNSLGDEALTTTVEKKVKEHDLTVLEQAACFEWVMEELEGFGPLQPLLKDNEVSEILVNDWQTIFYEKAGKLWKATETFATETTLMRLIQRLLVQMERVADRRHPLIDGTLADGTRVHVALPPVTTAPSLCLRRHRNSQWTLEDLIQRKMMRPQDAQLLESWVVRRKNLLICGPTGCGKTTLLRALLASVPDDERILILEDTLEIGETSHNHVSLLTRMDPEALAPQISLSTLLKHSLRMRPDRIIVGEVRGEEALILLDALATGHRGSMSSLHGATADQALRRLESLASRGAPQWSLACIRQLIKDALDGIVVIEKENGLRKISQAMEITGLESFGFLLTPIIGS
jgi:pilus assembly protein CpaF